MSDPNEVVMYLVFRADLDLPKGKVAAQAGHAVQGILHSIQGALIDGLLDGEVWYQALVDRTNAWTQSATKIALQVADGTALRELNEGLTATGIRTYLVTDEGRTCVEPGTETVLAVEPMARKILAPVLGKLRLYR